MITVSLEEFKQQAESFLDRTQKDHEPLYVDVKPDGFVVLSLDDYNSLVETQYLLQNEANAKWLKESIEQADSGQLINFEGIDERLGLDAERA